MMDHLTNLYIAASNRTAAFLTYDLTTIKSGDQSGGSLSNVVSGVQSVGKDVYTLLMWAGGFGCIICLIIAAITFGVSGQGGKRQEAKGWIGTVIIVAVIIFAAVFIIGLAQTIGNNLSEQGLS